GQPTDVVLCDAGVALYQELTGRTVTLSEYVNRSYLRNIRAGLRVDNDTANALVQRRQSSFANVSFLGRLRPMAGFESRDTAVVFARDYSFRQIKNDNAVLLGQLRSNPWIEPFLPHVGVRWTYDGGSATYYPSDTWAPGEPKVFRGSDSAETHESYCWIALLPNLGGNGNVLIVSATGGSAFNAGATFLADESAMQTLRNRLPAGKRFPHFEALLQVKGRSAQPRDAVVVICRLARGDSS